MQPVQTVRPSGVFAKVNRVRFSLQGNKFGACDGDGNVALWQAANASAPFFVRYNNNNITYYIFLVPNQDYLDSLISVFVFS